jgi:NAD(P)-dependent dehydrogenase (short-subunit alcohol dehydrogenase family)
MTISATAGSGVTEGAGAVAITGGSRGIGAAAAAAFARKGHRVFALSRSGTLSADAPRGVTALACDVTDPGSVRRAFATIGSVQVLVNNAGTIEPIAKIAGVDATAWANIIRANLEGAFNCIQAALPAMLASGAGTIINISSGAASRPLEGWSAYCASKAGLAMLTRSVHEEYGADGIACVGFRPGVVDTDMQSAIRQSGINAISRIPRADLRSPASVADALVWLAMGGARAASGTEVAIDDPAVVASVNTKA